MCLDVLCCFYALAIIATLIVITAVFFPGHLVEITHLFGATRVSKNSLIPAKTEAINPCFPALLTLFLTSFDCHWCIGPLAVSIHLFRIQMFMWHLKQFTHISIWQWKVIRPEPWLIVFRFDLRGSDWINDVLTGIHWSGRKELQVCRGIHAIIWGYDFSKMLLFHCRIFYFASQHLNQCLIRGLRSGTQINPFFGTSREEADLTPGEMVKNKTKRNENCFSFKRIWHS